MTHFFLFLLRYSFEIPTTVGFEELFFGYTALSFVVYGETAVGWGGGHTRPEANKQPQKITGVPIC